VKQVLEKITFIVDFNVLLKSKRYCYFLLE